MAAAGKWFLNSNDMWITYGFAVGSGSDDLLQPRSRKEVYSNDWPEYNGKQYDLAVAPKWQDRVFNIKGFLIGTSEADFNTKFSTLKTALSGAGTVTIRCAEIETTINGFLLNITNVKRHTRMKGANLVAVEMEIVIQEVQI